MSSNLFSGNNIFGMANGLIGGLQTGMSTAAAYREAEAANKAAEWNASIEDMNADWYKVMGDDALARGEKDAGDHRRSVRALMGKQRAGYAKSGVKVDTGSAATPPSRKRRTTRKGRTAACLPKCSAPRSAAPRLRRLPRC